VFEVGYTVFVSSILDRIGQPVPTVLPADLQRAYNLRLQHPDRKLALYGFQYESDVEAVGFREVMLRVALHYCEHHPNDPLAPWRQGKQFDASVIAVAARAPLTFKLQCEGFPFEMELETFVQRVQAEAQTERADSRISPHP
jgi:hypothetical protein